MANTYYDSQLTAAEIEAVLEAINGILNPSNNGKVLAISNGKFEARSVQWGGGSAVLEPLSVTANGDYTPEAGVDGFDEVHVFVPNSYSASDEGKVVNNGALVAQTARSSQITQNGTYDTTLNDEVTVDVSGSAAVVQPLSVTQNGTYNPPSGVDGYAPVTVDVSGGGVNLYTNRQINEAQITNVSEFTLLYDSSLKYGNYGQKVATRLAITDESAHSTLQAGGWSASGIAYYEAENLIGAYGGYDFGESIYIQRAKFWLNRYSGQNKTLIATVEYLDENGNWNEIQDLEITNNMSYPSYVFEVFVNRSVYGIRWIHKKEPIKTGGNNITFAGMSIYRDLGQLISVYTPDSSGLIMPPAGYDGFGPLYIP